MPLISEKNYAILGAIPVVQTFVGTGSVLKNLGLLVKDAWLSVFGPGRDKIKQDVDALLKDKRDQGYFLQNGRLTWMGSIEKGGEDHETEYLELSKKIHDLKSSEACPEQHLSGICLGIITAIPVVGTVINLGKLRQLSRYRDFNVD